MPHDSYKALYIHIPFCKSKCHYCDFASFAVESEHSIAQYFESLVTDIRKNASEGELSEVETVYIGGGTPTFVGTKYLSQLLYTLGVSMHLTENVECTIEGNPDSIDERLVADIWALGANRLSIGVQSFDNKILSSIGRVHTSDDALRAIDAAHTRFDNVSVDLMCGLPGQTLEHMVSSVERAISAGVTHVSIYPLTIEPGTKLASLLKRNSLELPSEDDVVSMMTEAASILSRGGFTRYEVASYARPGYECRHNIAYWSGVPYLGLGTSAATMTQNSERRMRIKDGVVTDDLNPTQMAAEDLMLAMRMSRGVSDEKLIESERLLPRAQEVFNDLVEQDLVKYDDGFWKPTDKGWLFGNIMYGQILDLAD